MRGQLPDGLPVEPHLVAIGGDETADSTEKRGLARPVRADDGVRLPLLDAQVDTEESLEVAVAAADVGQFEQAHGAMLPM